MVKEIKEQSVVVANERKELMEIPFGVLVWAAVRLSLFCDFCLSWAEREERGEKRREDVVLTCDAIIGQRRPQDHARPHDVPRGRADEQAWTRGGRAYEAEGRGGYLGHG